jgi:hypothetical protein
MHRGGGGREVVCRASKASFEPLMKRMSAFSRSHDQATPTCKRCAPNVAGGSCDEEHYRTSIHA